MAIQLYCIVTEERQFVSPEVDSNSHFDTKWSANIRQPIADWGTGVADTVPFIPLPAPPPPHLSL